MKLHVKLILILVFICNITSPWIHFLDIMMTVAPNTRFLNHSLHKVVSMRANLTSNFN